MPEPHEGPNLDGEFEVVWLGAMVPVKRLDILVDALRFAPRVSVTLLGDGPLREQILERACRSGVARQVRSTGFQAQPDAWLSAAHVAVLCSDAENCPLSLLQAMASGCAVVATAVGGVPEIVRDGREGILVGPGDPRALASALDRLRMDHTLRERMSTAAVARASEYGVDRMALGLLQTYQTALGTPSAGDADGAQLSVD
jgi:glycosyltransferase involved in cell wall biosynthesis